MVCLRIVLLNCLFATACDSGPLPARRTIHDVHLGEAREIINREVVQHRTGLRAAAARVGAKFLIEDQRERERQVREALLTLKRPPRGVSEFYSTPMSFLAAIDAEGVVICRDRDPDPMRGQHYGDRFPIVATAIREGRAGYQLGEFSAGSGEDPSISMLFAAPVRHDGQIVGALLAGIQLNRMSKLLSDEIRLNHAEETTNGMVVWAFMYRGDRVFEFPDSPPEFFMEGTTILPSLRERRVGLERSPGGYTGEGRLISRDYAFGVLPVERLGSGVGVIVVRSDPS